MLEALALDPAARHASIGDLIEALQEIELDLSILPTPAGSNPLAAVERAPADAAAPEPDAARVSRTTGPLNSRDTGSEAVLTDLEVDEEPDGSRPPGE
jgi:hypothetical protein